MQNLIKNSKSQIITIAMMVFVFLIVFNALKTRVYAVSGSLKVGWNIVTWQSGWTNGVNYTALPTGCDQLAVKKNNWFESWVRGYSETGVFEAGNTYYVKCTSEVGWSF